MDASQFVESRLLPIACRCTGSLISDVDYWVLSGEATADHIDDSGFYMGGEIEVILDNWSLFVSWDQKAGWPDGADRRRHRR